MLSDINMPGMGRTCIVPAAVRNTMLTSDSTQLPVGTYVALYFSVDDESRKDKDVVDFFRRFDVDLG